MCTYIIRLSNNILWFEAKIMSLEILSAIQYFQTVSPDPSKNCGPYKPTPNEEHLRYVHCMLYCQATTPWCLL